MLLALLAFQVQVNVGAGDRCRRHHHGAQSPADSAQVAADRACRAKRIPVTAQHLATAFRDPAARTMLLSARAARLRLDAPPPIAPIGGR
jgi:hypothetical protein